MKQVYLLVFLTIVCCASAQSPDLINYQGVARNSAGLPLVNRQIGLRFELRQGDPSGSTVFSEQHQLQTNQLGLFSTQIGRIDPQALSQVNWQGGALFLSVGLDSAGGTDYIEMGVQKLVSVPFALHARQAKSVNSSFNNNVLVIGDSTYTLAPPASFSAGAGIQIAGAVISNSSPDQTVTIQPGGNNVQVSGTYPDFTVTSTPTLAFNDGELSISEGNTVNITPSLSVQGNVISVGPLTNSVVLPSAPNMSMSATGVASVNPASGLSFNIDVPETKIALTATPGALGSSTSAVNDFNLNIPPPQYDPATGQLNTGNNSTNITPTLSFAGGILTVGPSTNNISIPSSPATTISTGGAASLNSAGQSFSIHVPATSVAITNTAGALGTATSGVNNWNINIPPPQYNQATGVLSTGPGNANITPTLNYNAGVLTVGPSTNNVTLPVTPATTLNATGAATLNPSGPAYSLHVLPTNIVVTNNSGAPGSSTTSVNDISINIPAPQYNAGTGILTTGTVVANITPSAGISGNVLTVGPATNSVTLPAAPVPTIHNSGIVNVSPSSGLNFTVAVSQPSFTADGPVQMLGAHPDYTLSSPSITSLSAAGIVTVGTHPNYVVGVPEPSFTPNGLASITGAYPNYTINTVSPPTPTVYGQGLATVSPSTGLNFTVNVPPATYLPGTGVLNNGTHSVDITPSVTLNNNVLGVGPTSNTVDLSAISPWQKNGNNVSLTTPSNYVGIGTSSPAENLQIESSSVSRLSVISGSAHVAELLFGTASNHFKGSLLYDQGNDMMSFSTAGSNRLHIDNSGNVGINKWPVAGAKLSVQGTFGEFEVNNHAPGTGTIANTILLSTLTGSANNGPQMRFRMNSSTNWMDIGLNANDDFVIEGTDISRFVVRNNGNVGIGTTNPTELLQLEAPSAQLSIVSNSTGLAALNFGHAATHALGRLVYSNSNDNFNFYTAGAARMTINDLGYVGINRANPGTILDLGGSESTTFHGSVGDSPLTTLKIVNSDNATANNYGALSFQAEASNGAGYVSSKIAGVHVNHVIGSQRGDLAFFTRRPGGLQEGMRVTGQGRVGINTTAPTATLHVVGNTRLVDGNEASGKVLTSDAVGNASWQQVLPAGVIMAYGGNTIPAGWELCDGKALSRTTYSVLFAAINTNWGAGDGSTTFNVPDMRGMFLRGVDGMAGRDPDKASRSASNTGGNIGNNVGSFQDDQFESHSHSISGLGSTTQTSLVGGSAYTPGGVTSTNATGGTETRPKNVYVYYIIKL